MTPRCAQHQPNATHQHHLDLRLAISNVSQSHNSPLRLEIKVHDLQQVHAHMDTSPALINLDTWYTHDGYKETEVVGASDLVPSFSSPG